MDLPMAQIPQFRLPPPAPIEQQPGLVQGLASGVPAGLNQAAQFQQIAMARQKMQQEQAEKAMAEKLGKFKLVAELYKNTSKILKPQLWKTVANQANTLLGTQIDPNIMPESGTDAVDAAHQEIQNYLDKKQSFSDTMTKLGMLSVTIDEEQRKAVEASKDFLSSTEEGQKLKAQGQTGSFSFAGYDPVTKEPVFGFSKAPVLVTAGGKPHTGPVQSKADLDKTTEEVRKIQGFSSDLDQLENTLNQIPTGAAGGTEKLVSKIPGGNLIFKNAKQYEDQLPLVAVAFYRNASGDTRVNNQDAEQRAIPFLPRLEDTPDIRTKKLQIARSMLEKRRQALMQGIEQIPFDPNAKVPGMASPENLSGKAQDLISKWENK